MKFVSVNNKSHEISFEESLFSVLAPDGGLYVPKEVPSFTKKELAELPNMSLHEICALTLSKWVGDEIPEADIRTIVEDSLTFPVPLVEVGGFHILELFHGPTLSFADFRARLNTRIVKYFQKNRGMKLNFLLSSYGDSGSALAHSCEDMKDVKILAVIPQKGESLFKKEQLVRAGKNTAIVEVKGNYNDCQDLVNRAFSDPELADLHIQPGGTTSIGRVIAQVIYFVYIYARMFPRKSTVVTSSSDFGNAYASLLARKMGIEFERVVLACLPDNAAYNYYKKGVYKEEKEVDPTKLHRNPTFFVRILHLCNHSIETFRDNFEMVEINETKIPVIIQSIHSEWHYLITPGTARAWLAADSIDTRNQKVVIMAKASPLKYTKELKTIANIEINDKTFVDELMKKKAAKIKMIDNDYKAFKAAVRERFS